MTNPFLKKSLNKKTQVEIRTIFIFVRHGFCMIKKKHDKNKSERKKGEQMIKKGVKGVAWTTANKFTGDIPSYSRDGAEIVDGIYRTIKSYVKKDGTVVRSYKRKR